MTSDLLQVAFVLDDRLYVTQKERYNLPHIKSIAMLNNSAYLYACSSGVGLQICELIKRDLNQWLTSST